MATDLVVIYESTDLVEAHCYRVLLEEAEIPVMDRTLNTLPTAFIPGVTAQPRYALLVPLQQADRAQALLEEYREQANAGDFALPDDGELDEPASPPLMSTHGPFYLLGVIVLTVFFLALVLLLLVVTGVIPLGQ